MRRSLPLVVALALVALALPAGAFARPGQNGGGQQQGTSQSQSGDSSQSEDSTQGGDTQSGRGGGLREGAGDFGNCMGRNGFQSDFGADFLSYRGTITAVDATTGAITATVRGASMTFATDDDTTFYRNGDDATVADL